MNWECRLRVRLRLGLRVRVRVRMPRWSWGRLRATLRVGGGDKGRVRPYLWVIGVGGEIWYRLDIKC